MDNIIYKDCKITDINKTDKTMVVVASDETIDRYDEVMIAKGCKYGDYIPFLWSHNRKEDLPPIGRVLSVNKRNNKVKTKVQFADSEFADSINRLYTSDPPMMEKVSVGFIISKDGDRDPTDAEAKKGVKRVIEKWELLEVSAVPIPANPNAGTERDMEMRIKIKDAVDSGEIQLPEMVYKDFGFKEKEDVIQSNTGNPEWEKVEEILDEGLALEPEVKKELLEEVMEKIKEDEEKPMENFHSCDISTKKYPKYRVEKCAQKHDGKCIDVNWGILSSDKSEISSLRYDIKIWTESAARSHCKSREGKFIAATKEVKAETFNCECIECGHKLESEKHCKDIKCPECGGKMRRVERPGPGKDMDIQEEVLKDYLNIIEPEKEIVTFKESPDIGLENVAQNEGITEEQVDELADKLGEKFVDSLRRAFRKNVLGIVDDE